MDAFLTDSDWAAITGITDGSGRLCIWCIDDLAFTKGIRYHAILYFVGYAGDAISGLESGLVEEGRRLKCGLEFRLTPL